MIDRVQDRFGLYPERLAADSAYGSAGMLGWLVHERGIEPHIPVFDKSARTDGTFTRDDFTYDHHRDVYICPAGKTADLQGPAGERRCDAALPRQQARLRPLWAQAALLSECAGSQGAAFSAPGGSPSARCTATPEYEARLRPNICASDPLDGSFPQVRTSVA